jgi:dihydroorotase
MHHHFGDGEKTKSIMEHVTKRFTRCVAMPNLKPPVTNTALAIDYYNHLMAASPPDANSVIIKKRVDSNIICIYFSLFSFF